MNLFKYLDFIKEGSDWMPPISQYEDRVRKSNEQYAKFVDAINSTISKLDINPVDVYNFIEDIMLEWTDRDMEVDDIDVGIYVKNYQTIYYPVPGQYASKSNPHIPMYGNSELESKIVELLDKGSKIYYNIKFGYDIDYLKNLFNTDRYTDIKTFGESDKAKKVYTDLSEATNSLITKIKSKYTVTDIRAMSYNAFDKHDFNSSKGAWSKFKVNSSIPSTMRQICIAIQ
jgi:hypothetical protein